MTADALISIPFDYNRYSMNKKQMSEQDIRSKYITPAIVASGWDMQSQIREEVTFTAGRFIVRGKLVSRGKAKRVLTSMIRTGMILFLTESRSWCGSDWVWYNT
jgi:type I site-specific restriction endonuclease